MKVKKLLQDAYGYPARLSSIAQPPKSLYVRGAMDSLLERPCVAIVGSRKVTPYGKQVTSQLAGELARHGVTVISGLALGVDAVAHRATLEAGGQTIAVLPSGLDRIHPATHRGLAQDIVKQGGALVTEYASESVTQRWNFVARNRIVSGLSDAILIPEAAEKSGTLHTARFALEQGKEVLVVPGNITSPTSVGANNLIKAGASPITRAQDILHVLGIAPGASATPQGDTPHEQLILDLIAEGIIDGARLLERSQLDASLYGQTLTMLEITGKIRPLGNNQWGVY